MSVQLAEPPPAVLLLVFGAVFFTPIQVRMTGGRASIESRPMMWNLAWRVIQAHPWLGVGAGNYALITPDYYVPDVGIPEEVIDIQVHNRYLGIWAESGVFALLCYVSFLGAGVVQAFSCAKSNQRFISLAGIGLGCAIISLCIQMITSTFQVRSVTLYAWLLPALAAGLFRIERTSLAHKSTMESDESFFTEQAVR